MPSVDHRPRGKPGEDCEICGRAPDAHRPSHVPHGDPCAICMVPARSHRVEHAPRLGDAGCDCGASLANHVIRKSDGRARKKDARKRRRKPRNSRDYFVGIDGEGQGREDHRYVLLAWSNEEGSESDYIEAPPGGRLTTEQCLDFLLSIPANARPMAYAFGYDLTKILEDVDDRTLYLLFRPELRQRQAGYEKFGPKPVAWRKYSLNLIGTKFTVKAGKARTVVWDVFKFFQSKFTTALVDWKVGDKAAIEAMGAMKDKRADFDKLDPVQVRNYCMTECQHMAALANKLTRAHDDAGIPLRNYFGAGSSASGILKNMGIGELVRHPLLGNEAAQADFDECVARAFFGGRFENGRVGEIPGPVWSYDISSAYPYQLYRLPCLQHGKWTKTRKRRDLEGARTAIVHYRLGKAPRDTHWGPFPYRTETGAIAFPAESAGGWVYLEEYLAGERLFPNVEFREAWVYTCSCACRPFEQIPEIYRERLRIGKEGPGIVLKLGCNSVYGKTAQSVGTNPPFRSPVWAGMITSGTRAQLLVMLGLHKNRRNLLSCATDGIYTLERLPRPEPEDTGTADCIDDKGKPANKPLGGWEEDVRPRGVFLARPGIYFPIDPTEEDLKKVRARGVGRKIMFDSWKLAVAAWREGKNELKLPNVSRFCGAKSSIQRTIDPDSLPATFDSPEHVARAIMSTNIGWFDRHPARLAARLLPRSRRRHPTWREILTRVLPKDRRWDDVADALEVVRAEIEKAACRPADRPVPKLTVALELRAEGRPVRYLYNRLKSEKHNYGQWRTREVVLSFSPSPKRDRIVGRHVAGRTWAELSVRRFDDIDGESHVYDRFVLSEDARALRLATEIALEQPSGDDMTEYEDDDRR